MSASLPGARGGVRGDTLLPVFPGRAHWISLSRSRARARRRFAAAVLCAVVLFIGYATAHADDAPARGSPRLAADGDGLARAITAHALHDQPVPPQIDPP